MVIRTRDPLPVSLSIQIYRGLIRAYPASFRQEFKAHMLQVFRDDCLGAFGRAAYGGLLAFWLYTIKDFLNSIFSTHALEERLRAEMRRQTMGETLTINTEALNRREFLNFTWLASLGFLLVDLGGVAYLFSMPLFGEGEYGGRFTLGRARDVLPAAGGAPVNVPKGKFWFARTGDDKIVAPYKVCPHLGCLYNWNSAANIFLCPCHYSQYEQDGTYAAGPAPRSLDRFVIRLLDDQGVEVASTDGEGNPLSVPNEDLQVVIDTGSLVRGKPKGQRYTQV